MADVNGSSHQCDVSSDSGPTLRGGQLNLFGSTVLATSSVGPAYTLAATIGLLFVASAYAGPAVIIISFLPMLFIAIAYFYLNRKDPNCGASFAWLSKVVAPWAGWFNGWIQLAAGILFCVAAPLLAASYTLRFVHSVGWTASTITNIWATAGIAAGWLILITLLTICNVRIAAKAQCLLLGVEFSVVLVSSVWGITKVATQHPLGSRAFHWSWLNPLTINGYKGLAAGALLGLFFFWGWDTAINVNEESDKPAQTPGRAVLVSMFLLTFIFLLNIVAAQMLIPRAALNGQGANLLFYFSEQVAGKWLGYCMIFAVLSSTVAVTQTTLLPAARLTLSMAREGAFPRLFSKIHSRYETPLLGTLVLGAVALVGILMRTGVPTVNAVYENVIDDIGVLVAIYYGATGLACAWAFRKVMFKTARFFLTGALLPSLAGAFCFWVGYEVVLQSGLAVSADVLLVLVVGIPATWLAGLMCRSDFFRQKPASYVSVT